MKQTKVIKGEWLAWKKTRLTKKDWAKWHVLLGDMEQCELDAIYLFRSLMIEEDHWEEWVYKFATVAEQLKQETLH